MPEKIESLTVNQLMLSLGEWRRFLITLGESFSPIIKRWLEDWRDWEAKISPREDLRGHLRAAHYRGWMDRESMDQGANEKPALVNDGELSPGAKEAIEELVKASKKPKPPKKPRKKATGKDKG